MQIIALSGQHSTVKPKIPIHILIHSKMNTVMKRKTILKNTMMNTMMKMKTILKNIMMKMKIVLQKGSKVHLNLIEHTTHPSFI